MTRFLLVPMLALSTGAPAVAQTPAETATCIEVGEVDHRWIPWDNGPEQGDVSFQIHVTNTCGTPQDVRLQVEMLDADGFLVENTGTRATVRPGADTVRIKHAVVKSRADRIARYEVTVETF